MKVKDYANREPRRQDTSIGRAPNTFDVFTEIKKRREELDALISVTTQYTERNEVLMTELTRKTNALEELENLIDLTYEQLERTVAEVKKKALYREQIIADTQQQDEELQQLIQTIKERIIAADHLQQALTGFRNKQIELEAIEQKIAKKEEALLVLDSELISKQALLETFERNYAAKLHRKIVIKGKTKFKQAGQI